MAKRLSSPRGLTRTISWPDGEEKQPYNLKIPPKLYEQYPVPVKEQQDAWYDVPHKMDRGEYGVGVQRFIPYPFPLNDDLTEDHPVNRFDTSLLDKTVEDSQQMYPSSTNGSVPRIISNFLFKMAAGKKPDKKQVKKQKPMKRKRCFEEIQEAATLIAGKHSKESRILNVTSRDILKYGTVFNASELEETATKVEEEFPLAAAKIDYVLNTVQSNKHDHFDDEECHCCENKKSAAPMQPLRDQRDYGAPQQQPQAQQPVQQQQVQPQAQQPVQQQPVQQPQQPVKQEPDYTCTACNGPLTLTGVTGNKENFRCRDCGADYSRNKIARGINPMDQEIPPSLDSFTIEVNRDEDGNWLLYCPEWRYEAPAGNDPRESISKLVEDILNARDDPKYGKRKKKAIGYPGGMDRPESIPPEADEIWRQALDELRKKDRLLTADDSGKMVPNFNEAMRVYHAILDKLSEM